MSTAPRDPGVIRYGKDPFFRPIVFWFLVVFLALLGLALLIQLISRNGDQIWSRLLSFAALVTSAVAIRRSYRAEQRDLEAKRNGQAGRPPEPTAM